MTGGARRLTCNPPVIPDRSRPSTLYVLPVTSPVWLSVNGGGSYIRRSGAAYEGASDKDDIGGVVGFGIPLGSR